MDQDLLEALVSLVSWCLWEECRRMQHACSNDTLLSVEGIEFADLIHVNTLSVMCNNNLRINVFVKCAMACRTS